MAELVNGYMQLGFTGLSCVVGFWLLIWYFTKGRKQAEESKAKLIEEIARNGKIIDNCTAVIANNTAVIEANTLQRQDEKHCLERIDGRMMRHGEQLDELRKNQAICMALQEDRASRQRID